MTALNAAIHRAGQALTGPLTIQTRNNVLTELISSVAYGPFNAALLFVPVVLQHLGATPDLLAVYNSQTYIGLFLAAFSVLLIPRKHALLFLAIFWTIGRGAFLFVGLVPGATGLLLLVAVFWFCDGFPGAAYMDVCRRVYPTDVRGRALSVVRLGMVVAMLVSTPLLGLLLDHGGPQVVFPIAGVLGILSAWLYTRMKLGQSSEPVTANKHSVIDLFRVLRRDRRFATYLLAVVCFGLGGLVGVAFYPQVLVNRLQLSYESVSWLGLAQSISWVLGLLVWGRLVDRLGGPWVGFICFGISIVIPLCYIWAGAGWMMLPAYIVSGLTSGGVDLAFTNSAIDLAAPGQVYEYAALQRTVIGFRGLFGPFLGVWLYSIGLPTSAVFSLGIVFFLLAALLMSRGEFRRQIARRVTA
jgi:predicted MFS family arabinose efflux permease